MKQPCKKSDLRSCKRKIRYRSKVRAENALEVMMVKRPARDVLYLASYHCTACDGWHLGNGNQKMGSI